MQIELEIQKKIDLYPATQKYLQLVSQHKTQMKKKSDQNQNAQSFHQTVQKRKSLTLSDYSDFSDSEEEQKKGEIELEMETKSNLMKNGLESQYESWVELEESLDKDLEDDLKSFGVEIIQELPHKEKSRKKQNLIPPNRDHEQSKSTRLNSKFVSRNHSTSSLTKKQCKPTALSANALDGILQMVRKKTNSGKLK